MLSLFRLQTNWYKEVKGIQYHQLIPNSWRQPTKPMLMKVVAITFKKNQCIIIHQAAVASSDIMESSPQSYEG
jgi:hypothetical protein